MSYIKVTEEQVNELYHAALEIYRYNRPSYILGFQTLDNILKRINGGNYDTDNHLLLDTVIKREATTDICPKCRKHVNESFPAYGDVCFECLPINVQDKILPAQSPKGDK